MTGRSLLCLSGQHWAESDRDVWCQLAAAALQPTMAEHRADRCAATSSFVATPTWCQHLLEQCKRGDLGPATCSPGLHGLLSPAMTCCWARQLTANMLCRTACPCQLCIVTVQAHLAPGC